MDKDRFDALHKLAEQAWKDWEHKARHQWRLGFAIWGALLAASYAIIKESLMVPVWVSWSLCLLLVLIHWYFLGWIEGRIRDCRRQLCQYMLKMESLALITSDELKKFSRFSQNNWLWYQHGVLVFFYKPAAAVHMAINVVIAAVFLIASQNIASGRSNQPDTPTSHSVQDSTVMIDTTDTVSVDSLQ